MEDYAKNFNQILGLLIRTGFKICQFAFFYYNFFKKLESWEVNPGNNEIKQ